MNNNKEQDLKSDYEASQKDREDDDEESFELSAATSRVLWRKKKRRRGRSKRNNRRCRTVTTKVSDTKLSIENKECARRALAKRE